MSALATGNPARCVNIRTGIRNRSTTSIDAGDRSATHTTRRASSFNFPFLRAAWRVDALQTVIERSVALHRTVGAPPTWVLSNHDVMRHASRLARLDTRNRGDQLRDFADEAGDIVVGVQRARAIILLMLALPGSCYLYQGEELGLREVEDLPADALRDPTWQRSGHTDKGRDGCRVPLPWTGSEQPFGFSEPDGADPWLPQPAWFADFTAERQRTDPASMLMLYRTALRLRREVFDQGDVDVTWLQHASGVLAFRRSNGVRCVVNISGASVPVDATTVLLASAELSDGALPVNAAAWLRD
jgi:alpha-glucosidase